MTTTLPTGQVRYTRSYTDFGTRPVELVTSDPRGDVIEGHLNVPLRLVGTKPHTNERLEFEAFIASNIKKWVEWRMRLGWVMSSRPSVKGPGDPFKDSPDAETPDWKVYIVRAYFKPTRTILAGFTDIEELERQARQFGVDLWAPKPTSSLEGQRTKAVIHDNRPFEDPMQIAEQRRAQYGMKRSDLLIGDLREPWGDHA